ncbi:MAG: hypothetical protein IAF38_00810 [Bacteroidia bacterium]|nr:hypothetical protein [Bacteroidia bacterium]
MHGKFVIAANENDSLSVQVLGFEKLVIHVNKLANENDSVKAFKKFRLKITTYNLAAVYVNAFKIKPNERAYMKRIINRPTVRGIQIAESPITALWQRFSKRGKELEKLEKIFEDVLRKEAIDQKINTESLRKLVGDENITIEQFRIICPEITDDFILYADSYELYNAISASYKNWKKRMKKVK